jgi:hypothetical protein
MESFQAIQIWASTSSHALDGRKVPCSNGPCVTRSVLPTPRFLWSDGPHEWYKSQLVVHVQEVLNPIPMYTVVYSENTRVNSGTKSTI